MKTFLQKLFSIPLIGGLLRKLLAGLVAKEAQQIGIAPELEEKLKSQTVTPKRTQSHLPAAKARGLMQGKANEQGPQN